MELLSQKDLINPASTLNDIQLTATLPIEMVNAQQQLITWCDGKLNVLRSESKELEEATAHAKKMKWKSTTLQNQYNKSVKQIRYYEKVKSALVEGYYIVPNFPIQMFAIRTDKKSPEKIYCASNYGYNNGNHIQESKELPVNEGEYKNPFPLVDYNNSPTEQHPNRKIYFAHSWDKLEFPITMAKPEIMRATSNAMALKIFDRIGIMPATKKEDPVIIGQIVNKKSNYNEKVVSFMIAWHLNTNVI